MLRGTMEATQPQWNPGVEQVALSDVGLRRNSNQDSCVIALAGSDDVWQINGHLFVVADGMGAHAAGELASKMAVDIVPLTYQKLGDQPVFVALRQALEDANDKIHRRGQDNVEFHGMGTTCSALVLAPIGAVVGHVGDSRVYRLRHRKIEQLSFDHSLVWEMTAGGQIRHPEVPIYIPKNIITRSLGPNPQVQVDLEGPFPVQTADTFLLCSDGLTGQVEDAEIGTVLECLPPPEAARLLVDLANLRGGPDNITVIIARATRSFGELAAPHTASSPADTPPTANTAGWAPAIVALGVLVALALIIAGGALAAQGILLPAGLCWVLALFLAVQLWLRRPTTPPPPRADDSRAHLGRGPYTATECQPHPAFAERLARMTQQLQEAAADEDWDIQWDQFHNLRQQAEEQVTRKDFAQAIRHYAQAISFLMNELRCQRDKRSPGRDPSLES